MKTLWQKYQRTKKLIKYKNKLRRKIQKFLNLLQQIIQIKKNQLTKNLKKINRMKNIKKNRKIIKNRCK